MKILLKLDFETNESIKFSRIRKVAIIKNKLTPMIRKNYYKRSCERQRCGQLCLVMKNLITEMENMLFFFFKLKNI